MSEIDFQRGLRIGLIVSLLEGEGSFTVGFDKRNSKWPKFRIACKMTDVEPLRMLQAYNGGNLNGPYDPGDGRKFFWIWSLNVREKVLALCKEIYPYMSPRRKGQMRKLADVSRRLPRKVISHGHRVMYRNGCRCTPCKLSNSTYNKAYYREHCSKTVTHL